MVLACNNIYVLNNNLSGFDILHLGVALLLLGFFVHAPWRENMRSSRWRWATVPVICQCLPYIPVYCYDIRYCFISFPFILSSTIGLVFALTARPGDKTGLPRTFCVIVILISFIIQIYNDIEFIKSYE